MEQMLFLVPVVGLLGLLFAVILRQQVVKEDPGTDKMREIADAIAEGANAFLASEYRILVVFVAVLFFVIGFGTRNWITAGCFLVGSGFSTMAGYLGMNAAIRANSRTAVSYTHLDVYKRQAHVPVCPEVQNPQPRCRCPCFPG